MFRPDMSDDQKREVLLEMNLHQTEEAIRNGEITEDEVERLLPDIFGLVLGKPSSEEEAANSIRNAGIPAPDDWRIDYHEDGNIKSIGGVTQGVIPIPADVARKVMGDLVPPADPIHAELVKLRKLGERQEKATEKVIDLLGDILKELKRRK